MCIYMQRPEKCVRSPGAEVASGLNCKIWVLGMEARPPGRAGKFLNIQSSLQPHHALTFYYKLHTLK